MDTCSVLRSDLGGKWNPTSRIRNSSSSSNCCADPRHKNTDGDISYKELSEICKWQNHRIFRALLVICVGLAAWVPKGRNQGAQSLIRHSQPWHGDQTFNTPQSPTWALRASLTVCEQQPDQPTLDTLSLGLGLSWLNRRTRLNGWIKVKGQLAPQWLQEKLVHVKRREGPLTQICK